MGGEMISDVLNQLQAVAITAAGAALTALIVYAFSWLRSVLGIIESDSNEGEIRRAALTEAGRLVQLGAVNDPKALEGAAEKIIADLLPAVKEEGYNSTDIKDMILGAAGIVFPPANLLKGVLK